MFFSSPSPFHSFCEEPFARTCEPDPQKHHALHPVKQLLRTSTSGETSGHLTLYPLVIVTEAEHGRLSLQGIAAEQIDIRLYALQTIMQNRANLAKRLSVVETLTGVTGTQKLLTDSNSLDRQ